jgi:hypothetical protein
MFICFGTYLADMSFSLALGSNLVKRPAVRGEIREGRKKELGCFVAFASLFRNIST